MLWCSQHGRCISEQNTLYLIVLPHLNKFLFNIEKKRDCLPIGDQSLVTKMLKFLFAFVLSHWLQFQAIYTYLL